MIDYLGTADNIVSIAANYMQILGTPAGPIIQVDLQQTVGQIASEQIAGTLSAGAAAEATALASVTAAGLSAGLGVIVLAVSIILGVIGSSDQSPSTEAQALTQLSPQINDVWNTVKADYWQDKWASIMSLWNSPTGGLGDDLDNLAAQGTGGSYVKMYVSQFHTNAQGFVNNLVPGPPSPPGTPGAQKYWERPYAQILLFTPRQPDPTVSGFCAWYGNLPQPQPGPDPSNVSDPHTALPFLLLGIQSYLSLQALVKVIDPTQLPFDTFLSQFNGDLIQYANLIYQNYSLIINGLIKSAIPSFADVLGPLRRLSLFYLNDQPWVVDGDPRLPTPSSWDPSNPPSPSTTGYEWNYVYGVVDTYPSYGFYPSPVPVPSSAPSYIIDIKTRDGTTVELVTMSEEYLLEATLIDWVYPWVQNKLILGLMARWKALYLINGYDKVWSLLQNLHTLITSVPPPPGVTQPSYPTLTLPDGTIANGNWSTRELCRVLNLDGYITVGSPIGVDGSLTSPVFLGDYSLFLLIQCFDNIANGNWTGPGYWTEDRPTDGSGKELPKGLSRPASFRDRLAAAAAENLIEP
jgi:hypothetical protein